MTKKINKKTLLQKAREANGRCRACKNCIFVKTNMLNKSLCDICSEQYIKGYVKGYNTHKQEQRDELEQFIYNILRTANACKLLEMAGQITLPTDAGEHTKACAKWVYEALRDNKFKFD